MGTAAVPTSERGIEAVWSADPSRERTTVTVRPAAGPLSLDAAILVRTGLSGGASAEVDGFDEELADAGPAAEGGAEGGAEAGTEAGTEAGAKDTTGGAGSDGAGGKYVP